MVTKNKNRVSELEKLISGLKPLIDPDKLLEEAKRSNSIKRRLWCLRRANELKENDVEILTLLGDNYFNNGKYSSALNCYKKVKKLNPNDQNIDSKIKDVKNVPLIKRISHNNYIAGALEVVAAVSLSLAFFCEWTMFQYYGNPEKHQIVKVTDQRIIDYFKRLRKGEKIEPSKIKFLFEEVAEKKWEKQKQTQQILEKIPKSRSIEEVKQYWNEIRDLDYYVFGDFEVINPRTSNVLINKSLSIGDYYYDSGYYSEAKKVYESTLSMAEEILDRKPSLIPILRINEIKNRIKRKPKPVAVATVPQTKTRKVQKTKSIKTTQPTTTKITVPVKPTKGPVIKPTKTTQPTSTKVVKSVKPKKDPIKQTGQSQQNKEYYKALEEFQESMNIKNTVEAYHNFFKFIRLSNFDDNNERTIYGIMRDTFVREVYTDMRNQFISDMFNFIEEIQNKQKRKTKELSSDLEEILYKEEQFEKIIELYELIGENDKAKELKTSIDMFSQNRRYAIRIFKEAEKLYNSPGYKKLIEPKIRSKYIEKYNLSLKSFDACLKSVTRREKRSEIYNYMGIINNRIGAHELALECFNESIKQDPCKYEVEVNLGQTLYLYFGKINEACSHLRKANQPLEVMYDRKELMDLLDHTMTGKELKSYKKSRDLITRISIVKNLLKILYPNEIGGIASDEMQMYEDICNNKVQYFVDIYDLEVALLTCGFNYLFNKRNSTKAGEYFSRSKNTGFDDAFVYLGLAFMQKQHQTSRAYEEFRSFESLFRDDGNYPSKFVINGFEKKKLDLNSDLTNWYANF